MSTGAGGVIVTSTGISELEKTLVSGGNQKKEKAPEKICGTSLKKEIAAPDQVAARIDTSKCVNCGTCRENCPAGAIQENQRTTCKT